MITGVVLLVATVVLRMASTNRHIRGRLSVSAFVFAIYTLLSAATTYLTLSADLSAALTLVLPLLVSFGVINGAVAVAVNPFRLDRLPDRFPNIVQDTIVIVLFAVAATIILQDRIFATTAVGAVVIGFALQDTLGNLFAGLAIQIEKPFRVGHWVRIADTDGEVSEITWRATKVRTKSGNFVVVPNSTLSKDTITNYSEPTPEFRVEVEVGASYDAAPNFVKSTIADALRDEPLMLPARPPEVLLVDFAASAVVYRIRVWSSDFAADERLRDHIRSAVYYAFKRAGISIPYPIQVEIPGGSLVAETDDPSIIDGVLRRAEIFAALDDRERASLAQVARRGTYAAGEVVVRQGEAGTSMFIIERGEAVVTLAPGDHEIARLRDGSCFGEMSLLTGSPRTATVRSASDSDLVEITLDAFRTFVLANPAAVEQIGGAVARRAAELEQARATTATAGAVESAASLVGRIRKFLRI